MVLHKTHLPLWQVQRVNTSVWSVEWCSWWRKGVGRRTWTSVAFSSASPAPCTVGGRPLGTPPLTGLSSWEATWRWDKHVHNCIVYQERIRTVQVRACNSIQKLMVWSKLLNCTITRKMLHHPGRAWVSIKMHLKCPHRHAWDIHPADYYMFTPAMG